MSPNVCSSMMLTRPKSSSSEFWSGVAVNSSLSNGARALLIALPILFEGLYTLRRRWASSMTARFHATRRNVGLFCPSELVRTDDNLRAVESGIQVPVSNLLVGRSWSSRITEGRWKLVRTTLGDHCLRRARWNYDENLSFAFGPSLGQENPSLNRLSETNFVSEECPFRQWRAKSE